LAKGALAAEADLRRDRIHGSEPTFYMNSINPGLLRWALTAAAVCVSACFSWAASASDSTPRRAEPIASQFEKTVQAYEAADKLQPPPKGAILLAGDSQFFRWKTVHEDLPGYRIVNRGIDSFQLSDVSHFTERLIFPHEPRMIILHVGGNDVHHGKTPERVLEDFKQFVAKIHARWPDLPIAFSSITPGPGRWDEAERRKRTNDRVKEYVASERNLHFIDLWNAMLTSGGQPREELWVEDRVHPNHAGYLLRVEIMRPLLGEPDKKTK
jgi:lysophospholipase L1-like esterase